jgi:hypothetical protein
MYIRCSLARSALTFGGNTIFSNNMQDLKIEARNYYVFLNTRLKQTAIWIPIDCRYTVINPNRGLEQTAVLYEKAEDMW